MNKFIRYVQGMMLLLTLAASGCTQASDDGFNAGNLRGYNHVADQTVNSFSVNGYGATMTGNTCCVMIPEKWYPGLKAHVEWEVDPAPHAHMPPLGTDEFRAAYAKHESNYRHYSADVDIIQYDRSCGLTVHFLTCQKVKITAACSSYGTASYPVKEPVDMKEPASCPK
ncbi:DUF3304 domain-containing protein [Ewingella americana]